MLLLVCRVDLSQPDALVGYAPDLSQPPKGHQHPRPRRGDEGAKTPRWCMHRRSGLTKRCPPRRFRGLPLPPSWNYPAPVSASSARACALICQVPGQHHGCCEASQPPAAHNSSAARLRSDTPEPARVRPGWRPAHTRHPAPHHNRARPCTESGGSTAQHARQAGNPCGGSYGTEPPDLYTGRAAGLPGVRSGWGEGSHPCRCCWGGCCRSLPCRCWPCRTRRVGVVVPAVVLIGWRRCGCGRCRRWR